MTVISFDGMRLQFSGCTGELLEMKAFETSDNLYLSAAENRTPQEALSPPLSAVSYSHLLPCDALASSPPPCLYVAAVLVVSGR